MAKKQAPKVLETTEEAAEVAAAVVEKIAEKGEKKEGMYDKVKVSIPVHLRLAGVAYSPGIHIVERHQLDTIREMVDKKMKADLSIFVGKNYLLERLTNNALVVKEVDKL